MQGKSLAQLVIAQTLESAIREVCWDGEKYDWSKLSDFEKLQPVTFKIIDELDANGLHLDICLDCKVEAESGMDIAEKKRAAIEQMIAEQEQ